MKILVLGGTVFVGRHLVSAALQRGHECTLFHRGRSRPDPVPDVETVLGDRLVDLGLLAERRWDAIVDTCGYTPGPVSAAAQALSGSAPRYLFISTLSVMGDLRTSGQDESAALAVLPPGADDETVTPQTYGALKVLCERAVLEAFAGRVLIVRPGLLVGPHDPTDRFTERCRRVAAGGRLLAGPADQPVQWLDARDLAEFMVTLLEDECEGVYHAAGPELPATTRSMLLAMAAALGSSPEFLFADDEFLLAHDVAPFRDLPLWLPAGRGAMLTADTRKAQGAGLSFSRFSRTVTDTLAWDAARGTPTLTAGLPPDRADALAAAWETATR